MQPKSWTLSGLVRVLPLAIILVQAGCGGSESAPAPAPKVSMPALVTADEAGYVAWVSPQAGYTYQWSISGGDITSFGQSPRPAFRPGSSGEVQLTCVQVSPDGRASLPGIAKATIVPAPVVPTVSAPTFVTDAQPGYQASVPEQQGCTYAWTIAGGTLTAGTTTSTATFTPSGTGPLRLSCVATNAAGTKSAPGTFTSASVPPPAVPVISGPAYVTAAQAGYLASVPAQANSTYAWSISGGVLTSLPTEPQVAFTPSGSGAVQLACVVANAAGTASQAGHHASLIVAPPDQPVITGPPFVTAAQAGYVATVPNLVGITYAWSVTGGTLTDGATAAAVTFTPAGSGTTQLTCVATNLAGTSSAPGTATSTIVAPPQTPVLATPVFVISNQKDYTASSPRAPGNILTWDMDGGSFNSSSSGETITFTPATGTTLTVGCVATNQAGTTSPRAVAAIPIAPPPITPIQRSVRLPSLGASPLGISLNDLRPSARMSVSITNLSDTPLLNPQIYPENAPLAYTFEDITRTLPPATASPRERCEAAWRYMCNHYWHNCNAGSPGSYDVDNAYGIFSSINGYGFGCCDQVARYLAMLLSNMGYPTRVALMPFHTLCEVYYEGGWHMFDVDHRTFYLQRNGQTVASVEDVLADPELVVLAADANGLDPVSWEARRMADLYAQNGPELRYENPGYAPPIPLNLRPNETFSLFHANQVPKVVSYPVDDAGFITDINSGLFHWRIPAEQRTLDVSSRRTINLRTSTSTHGVPVLRQNTVDPGSLTFRQSSPYPLQALQVWARWDGTQGSLTARFSPDGTGWSDPVPFTPNRHRAGYTHAVDLTSYLKFRKDYFVYLEFNGGCEIAALAMDSHVQVSRFNFPLFPGGIPASLHYKDDSPQAQARNVLTTLKAVPLDNQIQDLDLAVNVTPSSTPGSFQDMPELLASTSGKATTSHSKFEFILTLDRPRLVRKITAGLLDRGGTTTLITWKVQSRQGPEQPWADHVSGNQVASTTLAVDTFITAKQIRLTGGADSPVQFHSIEAFGHPPTVPMDGLDVRAGATASTNLRGTSTSSAMFLIDEDLSTTVKSDGSRLDHTLTFPEPVELSTLRLHWGEMGAHFSNVVVAGLTESQPTWIRLATWAGPGGLPSLTLPLEGKVKALRIRCLGTSTLTIREAQVLGVSAP